MALAAHPAKDEADFLSDLFSEFEAKLPKAQPNPPRTPVKPRNAFSTHSATKSSTPCRHMTPESKVPGKSSVLSRPTVISPSQVDIEMLLDGVDDWDMDVVLTPDKPLAKQPALTRNATARTQEPIITPSKSKAKLIEATRCAVESVVDSQDERRRRQKVLTVHLTENAADKRLVILQDDWARTEVYDGDMINVLGAFEPLVPSTSSITLVINITSKSNYLILFPDLLLTATAVSNGLRCRRKPLLSLLVHSNTDVTPVLVWGNMLHSVVQACLQSNRWDEAWVDQKISEAVLADLGDLVRINISVEQAHREVKARAAGLSKFSQKYMSKTPKNIGALNSDHSTHGETSLLAITELLDVEEDIWSPKYGLKGKIDATLDTTISQTSRLFPKPKISTGPKPFEIKTGRSTAVLAHRAQTMLYNILASERYGMDVESGLLYYTQSEEVMEVLVNRNELRGLITTRNELAGYITRRFPETTWGFQMVDVDEEDAASTMPGEVQSRPFLPPTIDDERECKRCYALDTCMLYRRAVENVEDTTSPIADAYALKTGHLTQSHAEFFKKWEELISLEERDIGRLRKELWTMNAEDREAKGRCFASMVLDPSFRHSAAQSTSRDTKIHQHTFKLKRDPHAVGAPSLLKGSIVVGDAITVSAEPHLLALSHGYILQLTSDYIVIGVDQDLSETKIRKRLALFVGDDGVIQELKRLVFRIDKDELMTGMSRIRNNLAQLLYADGDSRRLRQIVDLEPPRFDDTPPTPSPTVSSHFSHLNPNQRQAMDKVLSAQDYALILGMPGTGKTTIISAIIKTLVELGKTILLTSYTHSAVDNILLKLKDERTFSMLRVGNVDKVHPDIVQFTLSARRQATTVEQLEQQIMTPPVVATTCLSLDHPLFSRRKFDYCIIDEASQITLPTCLGPLRFADKFVLVGDHFQLPPLVKNPIARKGGFGVSLFRRLSDAHPHAVVDLAYQYRMNTDIMLLSNKLIYQDRLRCGSMAVANQSLSLPTPAFVKALHRKSPCDPQGCWLQEVTSPSRKVLFVDTDAIPALDSKVGDSIQNEIEASLVWQITEAFLRCGIKPDQIGILSLYRQQVGLLSRKLENRQDIEIMTADRSQGRDKDCVIISMVRSNEGGHAGSLARDWRRMNVSFTRARSKLIIIGSRRTLQGIPLLNAFFSLLDEKSWILQLPERAHLVHLGDFAESKPSQPPTKKRPVPTDPPPQTKKENVNSANNVRPAKRVKTVGAKQTGIKQFLQARPILKDLANEEL